MLIHATLTDLLVVALFVALAIAGGAFVEWNRRRNRAATADDTIQSTTDSADEAERHLRLAERRSRLELKDEPDLTDEDTDTK